MAIHRAMRYSSTVRVTSPNLRLHRRFGESLVDSVGFTLWPSGTVVGTTPVPRPDRRGSAARCRQPRSDPRAQRACEQPQRREHRDPQAPADIVHRRLRLGQELAGVRHDCRRVAAAAQRNVQRLRAGLDADAGAARGRRTRRPDDGDHRRPGADGANTRSTAGTATDANAMSRILYSRLGQPHVGSPNAFSFNTATISGAGAVTIGKAGGTGSATSASASRSPRCRVANGSG